MKISLFIILSKLIMIPVAYANGDYQLNKVADGIYYHQGVHEDATAENIGAIANVGFIEGKKCVAVIDSGGSFLEGNLLRKAIKKHTDKPICYVINTHVHPDHTLGNAAFKDENPTFSGHEKLPAAMAAREEYFARTFQEILLDAYEGTEFIPPSQLVSIGEPVNIDLGNRKLTLTAHTTSHTDHDLTVFDQQTKTLWTGDLLFIDRIPVIDGSINGWIDITTQLMAMDINHIVPGHGNSVSKSWQQAFKKQFSYLSLIREQLRTIIADMGTIEEASEKVGLKQQNQWELFENYHRRNVTASFVELEWE